MLIGRFFEKYQSDDVLIKSYPYVQIANLSRAKIPEIHSFNIVNISMKGIYCTKEMPIDHTLFGWFFCSYFPFGHILATGCWFDNYPHAQYESSDICQLDVMLAINVGDSIGFEY